MADPLKLPQKTQSNAQSNAQNNAPSVPQSGAPKIGSNALADFYSSAQGASRAYADAAPDVLKTIQQSQKQLQAIFSTSTAAQTRVNAQINQGYDALLDAQGKLVDISRWPRGIANLIGIFDSDFSSKHQLARAAKAGAMVQQGATRLDSIKTFTKTQTELLSKSTKNIIAQHDLLKDLSEESRAAIGTELTLAEEARTQQDRAIEVLDDNALAQAIKAGGTEQLPLGLLEAEADRRDKIKIDLETSTVALKAGKFELAEQIRQRALSRFTVSDLKEALEASDANGGQISIGGANYTSSELSTRLSSVVKSRAEEEATRFENTVTVKGADLQNAAIDTQMQNLNRAFPGGLSPQDQAKLEEGKLRVAAAAQTGNPKAVSEQVTKANEVLEQIKKDYLAKFDKEQQEAAKQFADTGTIQTANAAASFLVPELQNPTSFAGVWTMEASARKVSSALTDLIKDERVFSLDVGDKLRGGNGAFEFPTGKKAPRDELLRQAINLSGARTDYAVRLNVLATQQAIAELGKSNPLFKQLLGADGKLTQESMKYNPKTGGYSYDPKHFILQLSKKRRELELAGASPEDADLSKQLLQYLQAPGKVQTMIEQYRSGLNLREAAFDYMMTGGNAAGIVYSQFQDMIGLSTSTYQAVLEDERVRKAQADEHIRRQAAFEEFSKKQRNLGANVRPQGADLAQPTPRDPGSSVQVTVPADVQAAGSNLIGVFGDY